MHISKLSSETPRLYKGAKQEYFSMPRGTFAESIIGRKAPFADCKCKHKVGGTRRTHQGSRSSLLPLPALPAQPRARHRLGAARRHGREASTAHGGWHCPWILETFRGGQHQSQEQPGDRWLQREAAHGAQEKSEHLCNENKYSQPFRPPSPNTP